MTVIGPDTEMVRKALGCLIGLAVSSGNKRTRGQALKRLARVTGASPDQVERALRTGMDQAREQRCGSSGTAARTAANSAGSRSEQRESSDPSSDAGQSGTVNTLTGNSDALIAETVFNDTENSAAGGNGTGCAQTANSLSV
jgi:hypothetical protein